jgi:hypothetical protein
MTPQQQMIVESFQSETYVQHRLDVQHTPIWDTVTYSNTDTITQTNSAFFTNVGPASGKTLAGTNMTQTNKLPAPEAFSILGFRFRWAENALLADLLGMVNGFAYNFVLGQKPYNQAPPWFYCSGGGINSFFTITDQATYTNGVPSREAMHKLAIPIVIENQMNFSANLVGNNLPLTAAGSGGTGLVLQSLLDGLYARGVQ